MRDYGGAGIVVLALVYFVAHCVPRLEQLDDAYISYRYALNLVRGHGLVYNIDERVEGFTNLLWTLLVALGFWLHDWDGPTITYPLSIVCGAAGLLAAWGYARALMPPAARWQAGLVPAVIVTCTAFFRWHTSGLETPLFICLVVASCWAASFDRFGWAAAGCMLATLTRPEGVLLAGCIVALPALPHILPVRGVTWRRMATAFAPSLAYAIFLCLFTLWRFAYYGNLVPNTFHAKIGQVGWHRGLWYAASFLADGSVWLIPGAAVAAWYLPRLRYALLFALINTLYIVDIGGDVFLGGRFMLTSFPLLVIANVALGGLPLRAAWQRRGVVLPALICGFFGLFAPIPSWSTDVVRAVNKDDVWFNPHKLRENSFQVFPGDDKRFHDRIAAMRQAVPGLRSVATVGVGRIGYFAMDLTIIDLVGLLDKHIARSTITIPGAILLPGHSRTDAAYVLARAPDIIDIPPFAGYVPPGAAVPIVPLPGPHDMRPNGVLHLPSVMELWRNPKLVQDYVFDTKINGWIRKVRTDSWHS